jgi:hypothetical protein
MDSDSRRSFANYGNSASYDSDQRIGLSGNPPTPIGRRSRPPRTVQQTVELATENERPSECETPVLIFNGHIMDATSIVSNSTPASPVLQPVKHPTLHSTEVGKPIREDTSPIRTDESIRAYYDLLDHTINMPGWSEHHAETCDTLDDFHESLKYRRLPSADHLTNAHPEVRLTLNNHRIVHGTPILDYGYKKHLVHPLATSPVPSPFGTIHITETGEISVPVNVKLRLRNAVRAAPSTTTDVFCRLTATQEWLNHFWPQHETDEIREHLQNWFERRNYKYVSVARILPTLERYDPYWWFVKLSVHKTEITSCPDPSTKLENMLTRHETIPYPSWINCTESESNH